MDILPEKLRHLVRSYPWKPDQNGFVRYTVFFRDSEIVDDDLSLIDGQSVGSIVLENTSISDVGVAVISKWQALSSIDLCNSRISDRSLALLKNLPRLEDLYIESTAVTRDAIIDFKIVCPNCEVCSDFDDEFE
jgi:hypothetical protein